MSIYVRAEEAARILGVSKPTLYAYVSRGRVDRIVAADGRSSLFDVGQLEEVSSGRGQNRPVERPSIDAQISSSITLLSEDGVVVRGHSLPDLVEHHWFEEIAELLWTSKLPNGPIVWPSPSKSERALLKRVDLPIDDIARIAVAAHLLHGLSPDDDAPTAARRLLAATPTILAIRTGRRPGSGPLAVQLGRVWRTNPSDEFINAIDTALGLLSDHELATSTLAVRVAASVRSSPYEAMVAGLATVAGALHGSASHHAHRLLRRCAEEGVAPVVDSYRGRRVPGFGHTVYRGADPRYPLLLEAVRALGADQAAMVEELVATVATVHAVAPNIDLALGALTWVAELEPGVPIFAVARIAGWAAHDAEERQARPVRYRGLSRQP